MSFSVQGPAERDRVRCAVRTVLAVVAALPGLAPVRAQTTVALDPLTVTATRAPQPPRDVPFSLVTLPGDALREAPTATLDGALRSVPGFSLFRRGDSLVANPSAQGVSLRGLGPSGASRSLVLLDGLPLTDPFGGWVLWTQVPREALARAEIVRGGGATAWGDAALGGVVQLLTEPPGETRGRFAGLVGARGTRSAELAVSVPAGRGTLQVLGRDFATDGFSLVAPEGRGPVDVPAWSRHRWLTARWLQPIGRDADLLVTARTFAETRGNGTPYQRNASRVNAGAATLRVQAERDFGWTATAYAQDQSFASTFGSVDATRTSETPASDQYAVPATACGGAWTGVWSAADGARTSAGADLRAVRGETREHYLYANGGYARGRIAGGAQAFAGVFALHERALLPGLRATLGARLDDARDRDGHRRETTLADGAPLRDERYAAREALEFSPSAGLVWQPDATWRMHAAAQRSFRRPTLNELYRPFRVGSIVTESNPALRTEHAVTAELGAETARGPFTAGVTGFWSRLDDAAGNVTVARGPGVFPLFGALADGAIGRQKLNLDRVRVQGVEFSAEWRATPALTFSAAGLWEDARVMRAEVAPALAGKRLAQVPRTSATLGASWRAPGRLTLTPRLRWIGRQFEDDENRLPLRPALVLDLGVSFAWTPRVSLFLNVENLGDARVETGRSTTSLVNTGTPRLAMGGVRAAW